MELTAWQVEHRCPQCGGTVDLLEAQRLFTCPFCRVRLLITTDTCFRYMLPATPGPEPLIYVPYQRFKGMYFLFSGQTVASGLTDLSRCLLPYPMLPSSLGLRADTLKLKFVTSETTGGFIEPSDNWKRPPGRDAAAGDRIYVGERTTIVYAPLYISDRAVWDGILRERLAPLSEADAEQLQSHAEAPVEHVTFIPSLCPDCGWDLEGDPLSVVLCCRNCGSSWDFSRRDAWEQVPSCHDAAKEEGVFYLPFWHFEVEMEGTVKSYADAVRVLNLPKVIASGWEDIPFSWTVPAFKINPDLYLRVSKSMSLSCSNLETIENLPKGELHPVTLPLAEAFESLTIAFAFSAISKSDMARLYPRLHPVLKRATLHFHPFVRSGMELIRPDRQLSINANALKWGATV